MRSLEGASGRSSEASETMLWSSLSLGENVWADRVRPSEVSDEGGICVGSPGESLLAATGFMVASTVSSRSLLLTLPHDDPVSILIRGIGNLGTVGGARVAAGMVEARPDAFKSECGVREGRETAGPFAWAFEARRCRNALNCPNLRSSGRIIPRSRSKCSNIGIAESHEAAPWTEGLCCPIITSRKFGFVVSVKRVVSGRRSERPKENAFPRWYRLTSAQSSWLGLSLTGWCWSQSPWPTRHGTTGRPRRHELMLNNRENVALESIK